MGTLRLINEEFERMPKILVGSMALSRVFFPDIIRAPRDIDYLIPGAGLVYFHKEPGCYIQDAHGIPEEIFNMLRSEEWEWSFTGTKNPDPVLCKDHLFTLKVSHASFDIHWEKTMHDIVWMQQRGCKLDKELHDKLLEFWMVTHKNYKHKINLNKTNEEFFDDNVKRVYVHDDLHEAIKHYHIPMYQWIKDDASMAKVNHNKFEQLSTEDQLNLCREEIYVTALERYYIPSNGKIGRIQSYKLGARKLITSMTKGWFTQFMIMNWAELRIPEKDYIADFKDALAAGKIKTI